MSAHHVDRYLADLDEPKRSTPQTLRLSYRAAAFRARGKVVAGFAARRDEIGGA